MPAVAYLIYVQFRLHWRARLPQLITVVSAIAAIWAANAWFRAFYWSTLGGALKPQWALLIDSPVYFFTYWIGLFGSPTKGLFVFCPVLLLSIYAIPEALRTHRRTAIFVVLLVVSMASSLALLRTYADEVWGPRYLHTVVAPLLLCIGIARPGFRWARDAFLLALAAIGAIVSFLGSLYSYGVWHLAATRASQNTLEWLQGDAVWNPIRFNARLFDTWIHGGANAPPSLWTPNHIWMYYPAPADMPAWKTPGSPPAIGAAVFPDPFLAPPEDGGNSGGILRISGCPGGRVPDIGGRRNKHIQTEIRSQ